MIKDYILDTNVLLHDCQSIFNFDDNNVIIPMTVIEELDTFKKESNELGRNARHFSNTLDTLREKGSLIEGVAVGKGTLRVGFGRKDALDLLPDEMDHKLADNKILAITLFNQRHSPFPTVLISNDTNLRIKADALGIAAQAYENGKVDFDTLYTGITNSFDTTFYPNQYVQFKDAEGNVERTARYDLDLDMLVPLKADLEAWGLNPANEEQRCAMDLLLNDEIKLVTLVGRAGVGKTLLAIACALRKVTDDFSYKKLLVSRPIMPMGKDIGYLPGPQPLDAKVLTPTGWTTMGELKVGERVMTREGTPATILGIYPKGVKQVYKVNTTENTHTECCADHLWFTTSSENRKRGTAGSIKSTLEIMSTLINKFGKLNHHIPRNEAIQYEPKELPMSPYVLGVILGDGYIGDGISFASKDPILADKVRQEVQELGCSVTLLANSISYNISCDSLNNKPARSVKVTNANSGIITVYSRIGEAMQELNLGRGAINARCASNSVFEGNSYEFVDDATRWQNPVKNILFTLGLAGTKAPTKFIPDLYKYGTTVEQRLELLRGLMDTDGTVKKNGEASYCTTSLQLAKDIIEVTKSLGGRAVLHTRDRVGKQTVYAGKTITTRLVSYEFNISLPGNMNPFYLPRKAERFRSAYMFGVGISSIIPAGEKEVQCIMIDSPEHLYITDGFMVTHNTIEEKYAPYLQPIADNVEYLMSGYKPSKSTLKIKGKKSKDELEKEEGLLPKGYQELVAAGIMELEPLLYIRGRSIPDVIMITDECQNLSPHEIKTIVSRAGVNTKMIFTGDPSQIDTPYLDASNNGLTYLVEKMKDQKIAGHVTLTQGERSELADIASNIL